MSTNPSGYHIHRRCCQSNGNVKPLAISVHEVCNVLAHFQVLHDLDEIFIGPILHGLPIEGNQNVAHFEITVLSWAFCLYFYHTHRVRRADALNTQPIPCRIQIGLGLRLETGLSGSRAPFVYFGSFLGGGKARDSRYKEQTQPSPHNFRHYTERRP